MGLLARISTVVPSPAMRAGAIQDYNRSFYAGDDLPNLWLSSLSSAGVNVSPDLAMTLSAYYCAVTTIVYDLATLPKKTYKNRDDGGKDPVSFNGAGRGNGGIGDLAYKLRWAPNDTQTSAEFFGGMLAQYLLRNRSYAEIVPDANGFLGQLLPRHPDRVEAQRLPNGRLRYKLTEASGPPRYLTQDEMFVVRDLLNADALNGLGRVEYGAQAIGTILAAEKAAARFFKSGMTAAMIATYSGDKEDEDEADLHKSISRFAAGVDNSFGLMLVPDNITVKNLGVEPEKAQMMLAREWGVNEVARHFRMPGHKLGIKGATAYASQVQAAVDYVIGTLRPIAVAFEEAIQRDLILAKGLYFVEFLLDALFRGDPDARAAYYEKAIRNRWMRPSEVRLRENLNPDPDLDRLSEQDFRPGTTGPSNAAPASASTSARDHRALLYAHFAARDNAVRVLRRERVAVEKIAKRHASDVSAWQAELRTFYGEHARFIAETMHLPMAIARGYAAQHGSEFESKGTILIDGQAGQDWERDEADALAELALMPADQRAA